MATWWKMLALSAMVCGALGASALPAYAWDLSKSTNGIVLSREASDTTLSVTVHRWFDYKAGDVSWAATDSTSYRPNDRTAYNSNDLVCYLASGGWADSLEVPLKSTYRLQLVEVRLAASPWTTLQTFAVINDPLRVSLATTAAVSVTNPTSSTVSVANTIPVSVASLGSVDSQGIGIFLAVAAVLGGAKLAGLAKGEVA